MTNNNTTTLRESESFLIPELSFPEKLDQEGTKLSVLPYPEWRIKARKSGVGGVNRAVEVSLWGEGVSMKILLRLLRMGVGLLPAAYVPSPQHTPAPSDDPNFFSHHGHLPAATRLSSRKT
ncbi:hypothetical protein V5O48_017671, partial [Marasmius crinis-equi]